MRWVLATVVLGLGGVTGPAEAARPPKIRVKVAALGGGMLIVGRPVRVSFSLRGPLPRTEGLQWRLTLHGAEKATARWATSGRFRAGTLPSSPR